MLIFLTGKKYFVNVFAIISSVVVLLFFEFYHILNGVRKDIIDLIKERQSDFEIKYYIHIISLSDNVIA